MTQSDLDDIAAMIREDAAMTYHGEPIIDPVREAKKRLRRIRKEIDRLRIEDYNAEQALLRLAVAQLDKQPRHLELGDHVCPDPEWSRYSGEGEPIPKNPIGRCVYDPDSPDYRESCLFCGWPEERK